MLELLDNTKRKCDSSLVRLAFAAKRWERQGKTTISNATWSKWRSHCRIPNNAKKLTERETFLLLTLADLLKSGMSNPSYLKIVAEAERNLKAIGQQEAAKAIDRFCGDGATIPGSQLIEAIAQATGKRIPEKTLYHICNKYAGDRTNLPRYSRKAEYNPRQFQFLCNRIA